MSLHTLLNHVSFLNFVKPIKICLIKSSIVKISSSRNQVRLTRFYQEGSIKIETRVFTLFTASILRIQISYCTLLGPSHSNPFKLALFYFRFSYTHQYHSSWQAQQSHLGFRPTHSVSHMFHSIGKWSRPEVSPHLVLYTRTNLYHSWFKILWNKFLNSMVFNNWGIWQFEPQFMNLSK